MKRKRWAWFMVWFWGVMAVWSVVVVKVYATAVVGSSSTSLASCSQIQTISQLPAQATRLQDDDGNSYVIGYRQVSSINQDPILFKFAPDGSKLWCRDDYDKNAPDSRGYGLLWQEGKLYALFSVDGGGSGLDALANGWLKSYADASTGGGGHKVSVLLQINPADGQAMGGTFITARRSDGKINTLVVKEMCMVTGQVRLVADSWYSPRRADRTAMPNCTGSSPLDYVVDFQGDLSQATAVSSLACGEVHPTLRYGCAPVPTDDKLYLPLITK
jgi:hypothetical protein